MGKYVVAIALAGAVTVCPAVAATSLEKLVEEFAETTADLGFEEPRRMGPKDYGAAPYVCEGVRFLIPSLGDGAGGRIFLCRNKADRDRLARYYRDIGKASALFYSWVFVKGNVVLQLNGDLEERRAKEYASSIP